MKIDLNKLNEFLVRDRSFNLGYVHIDDVIDTFSHLIEAYRELTEKK